MNSEAGLGRGTIKKKVISAIKFKTYTVRASKEEPTRKALLDREPKSQLEEANKASPI